MPSGLSGVRASARTALARIAIAIPLLLVSPPHVVNAEPPPVVGRDGAWSSRTALSLLDPTAPDDRLRAASTVEGTIDGTLPHNGGVGFVVWNGGTTDRLVGAASEQGCTAQSVWIMIEGRYIGYTADAPAFVNTAWGARYASDIPGPTPLLIVCAEVSVAMLPDTPTRLDTVIIGHSVEGRPIDVYCVGAGPHLVLFVGGMHTGVEKNTVALARHVIAAMQRGDLSIPLVVRLCVLPVLNPDGLARDERTNAHGVDLNRNWPAADWQPEAFHPASGSVSAGTRPLSEPETQALADFVRDASPAAVVVWHSYAALVEGNATPLARRLGRGYAEAAELDYREDWAPYPITGQYIDAMEELGLPAIDVELRWTDEGDFDAHRDGINALLAELASQP